MAAAAFLEDTKLHELAISGRPPVEPFDPSAVQPASVDLRLGIKQYIYNLHDYKLGDVIPEGSVTEAVFSELDLLPNTTAFIGLKEQINIPDDAVGFVFPRSSITRLGVLIAPVFMNPGYSGIIPLTITNTAPFSIKLVSGVRVAQLAIAQLNSAPNRSYKDAQAKYAGENVLPSKLHDDREIQDALSRVLKAYFPDRTAVT